MRDVLKQKKKNPRKNCDNYLLYTIEVPSNIAEVK